MSKQVFTFTDKQLIQIAKDSNLKGTFKLIRTELLMNDELPPVHGAILEATKTMSNVYKFLTENCQKYGKEKTIYGRLAVLRAVNKHEQTLQNLISETLEARANAAKVVTTSNAVYVPKSKKGAKKANATA